MSLSSMINPRKTPDVFAEAKALRYIVKCGGLTYEEGKTKAESLLAIVNQVGEKIAKKHGRQYRKIKFSDL